MPVVSVNRSVEKKTIIGKKEGGGRGEAQGTADQKTDNRFQVILDFSMGGKSSSIFTSEFLH
jgi:hypothetical protein